MGRCFKAVRRCVKGECYGLIDPPCWHVDAAEQSGCALEGHGRLAITLGAKLHLPLPTMGLFLAWTTLVSPEIPHSHHVRHQNRSPGLWRCAGCCGDSEVLQHSQM